MSTSSESSTARMLEEGNTAIVAQGVDRKGIVDNVVKAAKACNRVVLDNCSLCTVYCDKQVQYEWVQENYKMDSPLGNLFNRYDNSLEVKLYREFLFDEASLVESVSDRIEGSS